MRLGLLPLALLLAACGREPLRIAVPPLPVEDRIAIGPASVEVLEISLPAYAEDADIFVQGQGGALSPAAGVAWADDTSRALTLDLTRALNELTGATVVPEPWPFEARPEARLDIRLEQFAPDLTRNAFVIRGQAFAASQDGEGPDRADTFTVAAPLPPEPGPAAIAAARAQATLLLARRVAEGLQ
jgi:uncharacterized lipoprotein YmbA